MEGLLAYILTSGHLRRVKLSLLANDFKQETGKQPKLLLNFLEIGAKIWSSPVSVLREVGDYPVYTRICGPDFHLVADRAHCFVKSLRSIGIEPVFFVDVLLEDLHDEKVLKKLKIRRVEQLSHNYKMQQVLERSTVQALPRNNCTSLVYRQLLHALGEEGAELVYCTHQPCSPVIAHYAQTHDDTCGVVSNNADFAIISGFVLFPVEKFDCEKMTGLVEGVSIDEKPGEILSMAISSAALAESLKIREDQLPDLAILCGTTYTLKYIHRLSILTALGVEGSAVEDIAAWLKKNDAPLMQNKVMKRICCQHPAFLDAIQRSLSAFAVEELPVVSTSCASPVYGLVKKQMVGGCDLALAAAKWGLVWLKVPFENLSLGQPSILDMLCPVRKTMYTLLGVDVVCEYGRTMTAACKVRKVCVCNDREEVRESIKRFRSVRELDKCGRLLAVYSLSTFLRAQCVSDVIKVVDGILESSWEFPDIEWPKLHKLALLCSSLRLMALNKSSLALLDRELDALLLSSLTCATEGTLLPHIVHILPSLKAVSISEWFCTVLDTVYEVACMLGLTEAAPEPRNIFYPMAFIPYHLALESHSGLTSRQAADIKSVKAAMETALSLPAVIEFRSHVFDTDQHQVLPELIAKCNAALDEVLENSEQLLPRTMTATLEELLGTSELDEEDEDDSSEEEQAESLASESKYTEGRRLPHRVWEKEELPIMEHRETILQLVADYQVVCIEGETGCGKSSQVPQFILREFQDSKILVSQPNYLAAKKLAERVSEELLVHPDTLVTHRDEVHGNRSDARLIYATNGFVLQTLLESQENCSYTHVVLDEIHERSTNIDFGMFLARQLAVKIPKLKIVLMSATLQGKLFVEYFRKILGSKQVAEPYFVGIRRFPVHVFYIDELSELISKKNDQVQNDAMRELVRLESRLNSDSTILAHTADVSPFAKEVCINLILSQPEPGDSILIFLPGLADMIDLHTALLRKLRILGIQQRFQIFIFHNNVPIEDEKEGFGAPSEGKANIIISHTLAESSLTFPHLKMVINFAIRRYMIYNPKKHLSKLTRQWCSKASCIQREGRVGRVSEGTAIHLIMRQDYERLADFNLPEIFYAPLSKTVLQAKQIIGKGCGILQPSQLLGTLIEPPSLLQYEAALNDLLEIGAILYTPGQPLEEAEITLLGEFCLSLPLDLNLCRLILMGIMFGCPTDAVVFAASFAMYQDIFTLPTRMVMQDTRKFCVSLTRSTFSRLRLDAGCYSKPIMIRNMYMEWLQFFNTHHNATQYVDRREMANQFAFKCSIRVTRLLHFETSVADIARAVVKCLPPGSKAHAELVILSSVDQGVPPSPLLGSSTYFTEETESSPPPSALSLRPNSTMYVPPHLRNLTRQRHRTRHQLHFCSDNLLLKALITAASSQELIYGQRCCESSYPSVRTFSRRCVDIAREEGFYPSETLCMDLSDVSDTDLWTEQLEETNESTIRELYDCLPHGFRFPVKVRVDKETDTAVLNFSSSTEAIHNIATIARDTGFVFRQSPVDQSTAELSKLSPELHVLWRLSERHAVWEVDGINAQFPSLTHPCRITWDMLKTKKLPVNSAHLNFRNPTGFMCLFKEPQYPYLAVSTGSFYNDAGTVMATDITLLPPPPLSLLMILAFQLPTSVTELLVDRKERKVKSLRLNSNEIPCDDIDTYLSIERLVLVNHLRHSLSHSLSSSLHDKQIPLGEIGFNELRENVAALLTSHTAVGTTSPSPQPPSDTQEETTEELSDTERLVWEMVTPGALCGATEDTPYYPELRCSLLGSEPYATVPAHFEETSFTATFPVVQYNETVSTKLLLENFSCVDASDDSDDDQCVDDRGELAAFSASGWLIDKPTRKKIARESMRELKVSGVSDISVSPPPPPPPAAAASEDQTSSSKTLSFPGLVVSKLEQEIVRHLQRNNNMEFLSELRVQRRIKHMCSLIKNTLNVLFFLQRPNLFKVREVEEGGENQDGATESREYLIVLDQSKWREVDSEDEEPVLPPSIRFIRRSRREAAQPPSSSVAGGTVPVVTEGTQTDNVSTSPEIKSESEPVEDKTAGSKASPSKPLTATKAVKLPVTKSITPHTPVTSDDKKKVDVKKTDQAVVMTPATRGSSHVEIVEHTTKQLSKEPAKKISTTPSKKKGPQPGTDDHLALFLYEYIRKHGGEVRLAGMRKEAFHDYYDRHPSLRYGGYRYLRKKFLLEYREYFEIFEGENKILHVRAVEEKQAASSHRGEGKGNGASSHPTSDARPDRKMTKQGQGKETSGLVKKTSQAVESQVQSSPKTSSTPDTRVAAEKEVSHTTDKVSKNLAGSGNASHRAKVAVKEDSKTEPAVHFVHVPSSSRLSQEPVPANGTETNQFSNAAPRANPSDSLSQLKSNAHVRDEGGTPNPLLPGAASAPPQQPQPTPVRRIFEPVPSERAPLLTRETPPAVAVTTTSSLPLTMVAPQANQTPVSGQPQYPAGGVGVASPRPSAGNDGTPVATIAPATGAQPRRGPLAPGENEEEWHSSEESWLSEDEFESSHGTPEHIAKYLYNYLTTHSSPSGCTVAQLDHVFQKDYKRRFRPKNVTKITPAFLKSNSKLFKVHDETFLQLREEVDHKAITSFHGRPYTPEHINDYYSNYLGREGGVCSLSELQDMFEKRYKKEYKMPVSPLIWFVGDSFFKRSTHLFLLFNDTIVFRAEGKH